MRLLSLAVLLTLAGCASGPQLLDYGLTEARVELRDTPFFPQEDYQCGPAALATILGADGVAVSPETLVSHVYLPSRKGSLQAEMVASIRRHDRVPYVLEPDLEALMTEVAAGTPVLVLQNLGLKVLPQWHYAVVIGYDVASDSFLLRSGTDKRLRMNRIRFQGSWSRAGNWSIVAVSASSPPTTAQLPRWLGAARDFEELDRPGLALQAYEAAIERWPDQTLSWQALANAHYAQGNLATAEVALRRALHLAPSAAAHNNLAHILLERGCLAEARLEITRAEQRPEAPALSAVLAGTRAAIDGSGGSDADDCSPRQPPL